MMQASPHTALDADVRFAAFFLLPGMIALIIFFFVLNAAHILAFSKGLTPYPRWCWLFCVPAGMVITSLLYLFGNHAWINAITAGWISIGNIWMFGGLLYTRLLLSLANAVGAGRMRQAMRELLKAYKNGIDSRAFDDVFEQFAWNMGIGFFSSEIAPSPLFQAYKTIKQMEKQGKDREEVNQALRERFANNDKNQR